MTPSKPHCAGSPWPGAFVVASAILAGAAASADLVAGPHVTGLRQGMICPDPDKIVVTEGAEGTVTGESNIVDEMPMIVAEGPVVPAVPGFGFTVQGVLEPGAAPYSVTIVFEHPPMGPDGVTRQTVLRPPSGPGPFHRGYSFDYPVELVPGPWTITVTAGEELILRADFAVVPESARPDLVALCSGPALS